MVITLCGSARFEALFHAWNEALTLSGHVVFSLATYPSVKGEKEFYTQEEKTILDQMHLKKIEKSDAIFVINKYAYIGESTLNEIKHAQTLGKKIVYLESWGKGNGISFMHDKDIIQDAKKVHGGEIKNSPIDTYGQYPTDLLANQPIREKLLDIVGKEQILFINR